MAQSSPSLEVFVADAIVTMIAHRTLQVAPQ